MWVAGGGVCEAGPARRSWQQEAGGGPRRAAAAVPDWQQLGDRNSGQCNILQSGYVL